MKYGLIVITAVLMLVGCQSAAPRPTVMPDPKSEAGLPNDVLRFVKRRELCDHFRGEEAGDRARGREIAAGLRQNCVGSDTALAELKRKYATDATIAATLSAYDEQVE